MKRYFKLDLHTHCAEATDMRGPGINTVSQIVRAIKAKGLDGIAITEHRSFTYAYAAKSVIEEHFADAGLIIIPGREVLDGNGHHIVELRLPNGKEFRFLAHPQALVEDLDGISGGVRGVEIENGMNGVNSEAALEMAKRNELVLLRNSDAHRLRDIGAFCNEVVVDEETGQWFIQEPTGRLIEMA